MEFVEEAAWTARDLGELFGNSQIMQAIENISFECKMKIREGEELMERRSGSLENVDSVKRAVDYYKEIMVMMPLIKAGYKGIINGSKAYISNFEEE